MAFYCSQRGCCCCCFSVLLMGSQTPLENANALAAIARNVFALAWPGNGTHTHTQQRRQKHTHAYSHTYKHTRTHTPTHPVKHPYRQTVTERQRQNENFTYSNNHNSSNNNTNNSNSNILAMPLNEMKSTWLPGSGTGYSSSLTIGIGSDPQVEPS